jgi:Domain of unknown function (DUF5664)
MTSGKKRASATVADFKKFDSGKPPISLIPRVAIEGEARVLGFGADKYGKDNWRKGCEWSRYIDAALRHMHAFAAGEDNDPESGESHLHHARCCLGFLAEYVDKNIGTDDRIVQE